MTGSRKPPGVYDAVMAMTIECEIWMLSKLEYGVWLDWGRSALPCRSVDGAIEEPIVW
jgi:hypothetical protein